MINLKKSKRESPENFSQRMILQSSLDFLMNCVVNTDVFKSLYRELPVESVNREIVYFKNR